MRAQSKWAVTKTVFHRVTGPEEQRIVSFKVVVWVFTKWYDLTGVLQSSSDANHLELAETLRVKGTDPNKTPFVSDTSQRFRGLHITGTSDQLATSFRESHDPLRFDNSLEQLIKLKKTLYLWLQFYYKRYKPGPAKYRHIGWGLGSSPTWSFYALSLWNQSHHLGSTLCVQQPGKPLSFGVQSFYWGFHP